MTNLILYSLIGGLCIVVFVYFVAAIIVKKRHQAKQALPPPRSKRHGVTYQQSNAVAALFLEVLALKESTARWPQMLERLNPEKIAPIRTILLDIRGGGQTDPGIALEAMEAVCIESKPDGDQLSRTDLLERVKARLVRVNSGSATAQSTTHPPPPDTPSDAHR